MTLLTEALTYDQARMELLNEDGQGGVKNLHMRGVFLQGGIRNQNQRVYPIQEIGNAVGSLMERINSGLSILGEVDHPDELQIGLDRVSHMVTEMWMDGPNGMGKLKILPTPMGNIVKSLCESGVKLGVSSRGSGNVGGNGQVSEFDIVTMDIVAQPSAPSAYPKSIYESMWRKEKQGNMLWDLAQASQQDPKAKRYLKETLIRVIRDL